MASSGDSTFSLYAPLMPSFDTINYNTCYPVIYKYLDIDELVYLLQSWYSELVSQCLNSSVAVSTGVPTDLKFALAPFSYTADVFRTMVRQCVLAMFSTQSGVQFNRYSAAVGSFEPFRCGTNCYAPNLEVNMFMPSVVVENLRMLMAKALNIKTKFYNPKNILYIIPVWGAYRNAPIPNVSGTLDFGEGGIGEGTLFLPPPDSAPNIWDGTDSSGNVCDFNATPAIKDLLNEWNYRTGLLAQFSLPTTTLGGSGNGILLMMTRFADYQIIDVPYSTIPKYMHGKLIGSKIRVPVKRTTSKNALATNKEEFEERFIPPQSSLNTQYTNSITTLPVLTDTIKQVLNYFIFPVIVLEPGQVPIQ
jgi:hypothetical protein